MRVGFLGAGQMARALAVGICKASLASPTSLWASDVSPSACETFQAALPGSQTALDNAKVVRHSDVVFIAVKPQHVADLMRPLPRGVDVLYISIAAGVPLRQLCHGLESERVVRAMPNTPCLLGAGASAYCLGAGVSSTDEERVCSLLGAVGTVASVPESLMDAVTGLSGSGPAYIFTVIEALSDAGVLQGLPRATALELAAQTVLGAARMVLETGVHPAELRDRVTSPGGTTAHGLRALEDRGLRVALSDAVRCATERSRQLGAGVTPPEPSNSPEPSNPPEPSNRTVPL